MTSGSGSRGFLSGRVGAIIVAVVVTGVVVFATCLAVWLNLGGGAWLSDVRVMEAHLLDPDRPNRLTLTTASCNESPRKTRFEETDEAVHVAVEAFSTPFHGGQDCQDSIEVQLGRPLGDRVIIDGNTGRSVSVIGLIPHTVADAQPSAEWRLVDVPGWPNQAGFSLRLPPGWELNELKGTDPYGPGLVVVDDAYIGEVVGDGARLLFDYGGDTWSLSPSDDRARTYAMGWENIGGVRARLLISMNPGAGYTGAFFHKSGGPNLHLVGEDLTLEQQRIAVAVFRSIRLLGQTGDGT